ncbi:MAG: alkaline phosphatase family protein [Elusimicrobia bacterium]|nr:alkaline phosphatase family protein [Elusimicrobiota bacterium]
MRLNFFSRFLKHHARALSPAIVCCGFFSLVGCALATEAIAQDRPSGNVVLVTLDGVRWQEFFGDPDPSLAPNETGRVFSRFWSAMASEGVVYGNPAANNVMTIANLAVVSLPAYQSIMAGVTTRCLNNECGRITRGTFPERLISELSLGSAEVATLASWTKIALAVERTEGTTSVKCGPQAGDQPEDLMSSEARLDKLTFPEALAYLTANRPRFLYISLNDSDDWAHRGDYAKYLGALRQYDAWLAQLAAAIDGLEDYGPKTTLIVTTDHGRGNGAKWTDHGVKVPQARAIWLYARGPHVSPKGVLSGGPAHTHLDIRPTIELLMGLCPQSCSRCGLPLTEVTSGIPSCSQ